MYSQHSYPVADLTSPLNRGLVAWYLGMPDERMGLCVSDLTGKHTGKLLNGTTWSDQRFVKTTNPGGYRAWKFVGTSGSSHIQVPSSPKLELSGAFSISLWCYIDVVVSSGDADCLVGKGTNAGNYNFGLAFTRAHAEIGDGTNRTISGLYENSGGTQYKVHWSHISTAGLWYHVSLVHDPVADTLVLYADQMTSGHSGFGVVTLRATNSSATGTPATSTDPLQIGLIGETGSTRKSFDGKVCDVRIYNRVISQSEIYQIRKAMLSGYGNELLFHRKIPTNLPFASVSYTPASADTTGSVLAPTVQLGSISISGATASVTGSAIAPTVSFGSLSYTPASSDTEASCVDPSVELGSITFNNLQAAVEAACVSPTVETPVIITGATASVIGSVVAPTVQLGSVQIAGPTASVTGSSVDPAVVLGAISYTPASSNAEAACVSPSVDLGSLSFTEVAECVVSCVNPTIEANVTLSGITAVCTVSAIDPTTQLGSISYTSPSADAVAAAVDPYVDLSLNITAVASAAVTAVAPSVVLGSLSFSGLTAQTEADASVSNVVLGSIVIANTQAESEVDGAVGSVVLGSISVVAVSASAESEALLDSIVLGSISIVVTASVEVEAAIGSILFGSLVMTADAASAEAQALIGSVVVSSPPVISTTSVQGVSRMSILHYSEETTMSVSKLPVKSIET